MGKGVEYTTMSTSFKSKIDKKRSACRRTAERKKISPVNMMCWSSYEKASPVTAIEADSHGARLMLSWIATQDEAIVVSIEDEIGLHQTQIARIAWVQRLESTGCVIAGVEFSEEFRLAS